MTENPILTKEQEDLLEASQELERKMGINPENSAIDAFDARHPDFNNGEGDEEPLPAAGD